MAGSALHRDAIAHLHYVASTRSYVTAASDGTLRVWSGSLAHELTIQAAERASTAVTDIAVLPSALSKLAVASADRLIARPRGRAAVVGPRKQSSTPPRWPTAPRHRRRLGAGPPVRVLPQLDAKGGIAGDVRADWPRSRTSPALCARRSIWPRRVSRRATKLLTLHGHIGDAFEQLGVSGRPREPCGASSSSDEGAWLRAQRTAAWAAVILSQRDGASASARRRARLAGTRVNVVLTQSIYFVDATTAPCVGLTHVVAGAAFAMAIGAKGELWPRASAEAGARDAPTRIAALHRAAARGAGVDERRRRSDLGFGARRPRARPRWRRRATRGRRDVAQRGVAAPRDARSRRRARCARPPATARTLSPSRARRVRRTATRTSKIRRARAASGRRRPRRWVAAVEASARGRKLARAVRRPPRTEARAAARRVRSAVEQPREAARRAAARQRGERLARPRARRAAASLDGETRLNRASMAASSPDPRRRRAARGQAWRRRQTRRGKSPFLRSATASGAPCRSRAVHRRRAFHPHGRRRRARVRARSRRALARRSHRRPRAPSAATRAARTGRAPLSARLRRHVEGAARGRRAVARRCATR